jgi:hypothetical protein
MDFQGVYVVDKGSNYFERTGSVITLKKWSFDKDEIGN